MKVIITDVESRKAFDVVNIMEQLYGYDCILCAGKDYKVQLPLIYGKAVNRLRHTSYEIFESDFTEILKQYQDSELVYLPVSERPTRFLYRYLKSNNCKNLFSLLPQESYFDLTSDKILFQDFCFRSGFPVPGSYKKEDVPVLNEHFHPLIIKPRKGEGSVGIIHIDNKEGLPLLNNINWNDFVVQEKLNNSNQVEGGFFLCKEGEVVNYYSHQRLRTFPTEGGVTVFSKSAQNELIFQTGKSLLKELNWNGLAMIEFLFDEKSQQWKIIELNPRIWGSILLSSFSGAHLLKDYLNLCVDKKTEKLGKIKIAYIRWIFPFDLLNLLKRKITFGEFINAKKDDTCYINFTYSPVLRSLCYLLYFTFSLSSIKRFKKKIT